MRWFLLAIRIVVAVVLVVTILCAPAGLSYLASGISIGMFVGDLTR